MIYKLYDSCGEPLPWRFSSWSTAYNYKHLMGRSDWKIKELTYKTPKQQ